MDSFNYIPTPIKDNKGNIIGEIYRPLIMIRLCYNHKVSPFPFSCLLDSGSDNNLFPGYFAQNIGIKLENGVKKNIKGIGNIEIEAYSHQVKIYVGQNSFDTKIDFCNDQQIPLLGRVGFFDHFEEVIFKESQKVVELNLTPVMQPV